MGPLQKRISKALRQHIGRQIKLKRTRLGMTQEGLAASLGYIDKRKTTCSWEHGLALPPLSILYLLSMVFGCPLQDFLPTVDEIMREAKATVSRVSINVIDFDNETPESSND